MCTVFLNFLRKEGYVMARKSASRKYQLTINNPIDNGYTHDKIKAVFDDFKGLVYYCMCDEIGEQGTYHTHIFFYL